MLIDFFSGLIRRQQRLQLGFGVFVLIPGVQLIRRGVMAPENHPALRLLLDRLSDVVWGFPLRHMNQAAASHVASDLAAASLQCRWSGETATGRPASR